MSDSSNSIEDFEILGSDSEIESPIPSPPTTPPPTPPNTPSESSIPEEFIAPHNEFEYTDPIRWCGLEYITDSFLEFLLFIGCIRVG